MTRNRVSKVGNGEFVQEIEKGLCDKEIKDFVDFNNEQIDALLSQQESWRAVALKARLNVLKAQKK